MKIATAAVLATFLFAGCGGSSNFTLNQNYEKKDFSDKVLLIAPIADDAVKVENKDDIAGDFPNDKREPETIIKNLVYKSIMEYAREHLTGVRIYKAAFDSSLFLSQYNKSKYFKLTEPLGDKGLLPFNYVPRKNVLNSRNIKPNMILVINRLHLGREAKGFFEIINPAKSKKKPTLSAEFEYILFDYDKNEVMAVGGSKAEASSTDTLSRSKSEEIVQNIAPEVFINMTFLMSNQ